MTERLKPALLAVVAASLAMGLALGDVASAAEARPVVRLGPDLSGRLIDPEGRRYLDVYNNVASLGHCHPAVTEAICRQASTLATNTRYLHDTILALAERLLAEGWEERRLTLSSIYRDATTNQYCLTAGQFIDNGRRLLLLDIDAAGLT